MIINRREGERERERKRERERERERERGMFMSDLTSTSIRKPESSISHSPPYFLRQGLSLDLELMI